MNLTLFINTSSQNETVTKTNRIAAMLADLTTPTSVPIYAKEIDLAVTAVSALMIVFYSVATAVDTELIVNSTFFEVCNYIHIID